MNLDFVFFIFEYTMMENAGMGAADFIIKHCNKTDKVLVFCGKGNNGGDGFVIGRKLKIEGFDVTIILAEGEPKTADAMTNKILSEALKITILDIVKDGEEIKNLIYETNIIVDAIYGTGFHGELSDNIKAYTSIINNEKFKRAETIKIVSLDIPSGISKRGFTSLVS